MIYILIAICFFFDGVYIYCKKHSRNIFGLIAKSIASLAFIAIGYYGYKIHDSSFNYYILIGLILDGLGDLFLALRNILLKKIMFFVGALSFLAGHIMYIRALFPIANYYTLQCIIAGILIGSALMIINKRICKFSRVYDYVGIVYFIMISTMACLSVGIYFTNQIESNLLFMIGAIVFISSDCILILNTFSKKQAWMHPVYSLLYYIAQILISVSLCLW